MVSIKYTRLNASIKAGPIAFSGEPLGFFDADAADLVGGDVVEVAPPFDPSGNTALVGATMMFEILCVLAPAVHRGKNRMRRL